MALVLEETSLVRVHLSELVAGDDLDHNAIESLLGSMKRHTKEVKAPRLGVIGKEHFATRLKEMGGDPERYEYYKVARVDDGLPFVLETAFSWLGDHAPNERQIFAGANWSAAIKNPFRSFGATGEGLGESLREQKAGAQEPIYYAARKEIEDQTDRPLSSVYFTQDLLPRYLNSHPEAANWWAVYDARGHLLEPHTDRKIALGTLEVEEYLRKAHGHHVGVLEIRPVGGFTSEPGTPATHRGNGSWPACLLQGRTW